MGSFFLGGIVGFLGLAALFGAAEARSGTFYYAGILVFLLAVAYIMRLVKRALDRYEARQRH